MKRIVSLMIVTLLTLCLCACTQKKAETAVLLYMIGSDLETEHGCATTDINEICQADLGDIPVLIQTGGADTWHREDISKDNICRFEVKNGNIHELFRTPAVSMARRETLSDFLRWSKKQCPAGRYIVLFWDHGGGTALGFGCDDLFPSDTLSLSQLRDGFLDADFHADMVGFDACLMGTVEAAAALAPVSDYLVASEETEPNGGWYYTDWLTELGENPNLSTEELCESIVRGYLSHVPTGEPASLAAYDLREMDSAINDFVSWLSQHQNDLSDAFLTLTNARCTALEFGENSYDQIDLVDLLTKAGAGEALCDRLKKCVISADSTFDGSGLAFYYPYRYPEYYTVMRRELPRIDPRFEELLPLWDGLLSVMAQARQYGDGESLSAQLSGVPDEDYSDDLTTEPWFDETAADCFGSSLSVTQHNPFTLNERDGGYLLDAEQLDGLPIAEAALDVVGENAGNYIQFGRLPVHTTENGLTAEISRRWISTESGQMLPFTTIFEENGTLTGCANALLNQRDDIQVIFRWAGDRAEVMGYRWYNEDDADTITFPSRGLMELKTGDELDFYCPVVTAGGYLDPTCFIGDTVTVENGLSISVLPMSERQSLYISFRLTDLFQCHAWTKPMVVREK